MLAYRTRFHSFEATFTYDSYMCPDEEKGCSARDLVIIESCKAENLLSNDTVKPL